MCNGPGMRWYRFDLPDRENDTGEHPGEAEIEKGEITPRLSHEDGGEHDNGESNVAAGDLQCEKYSLLLPQLWRKHRCIERREMRPR